MKKTIGILLLILALMLSACTAAIPQPTTSPAEQTQPAPVQTEPTPDETQPVSTEPQPEVSQPSEVIPMVYQALLGAYAQAAAAGWNGGALAEQGLNFVAADVFGDNPGENLGYAVMDLDGNGTPELVIGSTEAVTDDFYGKLILDVYTLNADSLAQPVFTSMERDRYYSLGGGRFAHLGSSSAADSFATTVSLENGALVDLGYTTESSAYTQLPLTPIGSWSVPATALDLPILDEIDALTQVGTAGSFMTAVQSAVKLLDWANNTGLDPQEIKEAAVQWLSLKGSDAQATFTEKLRQVDNACQTLLEGGAEDLLSSAGCENTGYPWGDAPKAVIEAIMEAAGLR